MSSNFENVTDLERTGYADVSKRLVDMVVPDKNTLPGLQILRIDLRNLFRNGCRAFHELMNEQKSIIRVRLETRKSRSEFMDVVLPWYSRKPQSLYFGSL